MVRSTSYHFILFPTFSSHKLTQPFILMIPAKHANALYFTPRTPWGTRVPRRALRSHMQASEDAPVPPYKKPDQSYLDKNGVPRALSGQITPERATAMNDASAKLPPITPPSPQRTQAAQPKEMTNTFTSQAPAKNSGESGFSSATTESPHSKSGWGLIGGGEGNKPTPGKLDATVWFGATSNPSVYKNQKEWEENNPGHWSSDRTLNER